MKKHQKGSAWEDKDKRRAVAVYKSIGSVDKTAEITGIPGTTIRLWMKGEWWKEYLNQLKSEDSAELEDAATTIAKQATEVVKERLTNGDHILGKDGAIIRKPVSARDAAIIAAVAIDKRKALQEEPVREQQLGTTERLLKLVEQFAKFANAKEIKGVLNNEKPIQQIESVFASPNGELEASYSVEREVVDAEQQELQT